VQIVAQMSADRALELRQLNPVDRCMRHRRAD
jgi:hypothetical protein